MTKHNTDIEWTHIPGYRGQTWNPIVGCSVISPGCTNCYAMRIAGLRLNGNPNTPQYKDTTQPSKAGPVWTGKVNRASDKVMTKPLRWRNPRAVFVNSQGDLFHESVPDAWIDEVFAVMALCPQHVFIILTKRAERMREYLAGRDGQIVDAADQMATRLDRWDAQGRAGYLEAWREHGDSRCDIKPWPLPNVWLGVSVEDQTRADERIPDLLLSPAAVRFVSAEPLLGAVDLTQLRPDGPSFSLNALTGRGRHLLGFGGGTAHLDWVICGGESGKGARPMHYHWARDLRDQCAKAEVPFFFKQWGKHIHALDYEADRWDWDNADERGILKFFPDGTAAMPLSKAQAGRALDGVTHDAFPAIAGQGGEA